MVMLQALSQNSDLLEQKQVLLHGKNGQTLYHVRPGPSMAPGDRSSHRGFVPSRDQTVTFNSKNLVGSVGSVKQMC